MSKGNFVKHMGFLRKDCLSRMQERAKIKDNEIAKL